MKVPPFAFGELPICLVSLSAPALVLVVTSMRIGSPLQDLWRSRSFSAAADVMIPLWMLNGLPKGIIAVSQ